MHIAVNRTCEMILQHGMITNRVIKDVLKEHVMKMLKRNPALSKNNLTGVSFVLVHKENQVKYIVLILIRKYY